MLSRCGREFVTLPGALAKAHWQALSRRETLMERLLPFTQSEAGVEPPGATPRAIWAGIPPLLLAGLSYVPEALYYPGLVRGLSSNVYLDLALHALLLLGLAVGWAYRFPRWSYSYLGIILMSSLWLGGTATPGLQLFGYSFSREQWGGTRVAAVADTGNCDVAPHPLAPAAGPTCPGRARGLDPALLRPLRGGHLADAGCQLRQLPLVQR